MGEENGIGRKGMEGEGCVGLGIIYAKSVDVAMTRSCRRRLALLASAAHPAAGRPPSARASAGPLIDYIIIRYTEYEYSMLHIM